MTSVEDYFEEHGHIEKFPPVPGGQDQETRLWPAPLDLAKLAQQEPDNPRFIIQDWMPAGYATLMAGHGGVGKSYIALQQAVCIAAGRQWWGLETSQRRVIYLSCEDRSNILHWRLKRICGHMGLNMGDLAEHLQVIDLVGQETIIWRPEKPFVTQAYHELSQRIDPDDVVFVDGISDTFGGNEIARHEVKAFVNTLLGLLEADQGALVLIGHVNKPSAQQANSEGYSGSTQWHNAVRARSYLYPETERDGETGDTERTGNLILELQKSNLGKADQQLTFRWDDAARMFVADAGTGGHWLDRQEQEAHAEAVFLRLLDKLNAEGRPVSAAPTSPNNAPKAMARQPSRDGLTRRELSKAMERLFDAGKIRMEEYTTEHRKRRSRLVRAEQ